MLTHDHDAASGRLQAQWHELEQPVKQWQGNRGRGNRRVIAPSVTARQDCYRVWSMGDRKQDKLATGDGDGVTRDTGGSTTHHS